MYVSSANLAARQASGIETRGHGNVTPCGVENDLTERGSCRGKIDNAEESNPDVQ